VCCPDNAAITPRPFAASATTRRPFAPRPFAASANGIVLPQINDFSQINLHQNINLINDKKCGTSSSNRIVGGEYL
jgi:hypothetical protein